MKEQILVTIGREHGSGGHYIAALLANKLNIPVYDKALLEQLAETDGYTEELVERLDEKPVNFFISRSIGEFSNSLEKNLAQRTFDLIRSHAESGESFVVVGRCGENVLRDWPNLVRIFVCGEYSEKLQRLMTTKNLTEKQAEELLRKVDRQRKVYHNYYCDSKWGDARSYDITINSSKLGIAGTSDMLEDFVRKFMASAPQPSPGADAGLL